MDGVNFIADHTRKEEESTKVNVLFLFHFCILLRIMISNKGRKLFFEVPSNLDSSCYFYLNFFRFTIFEIFHFFIFTIFESRGFIVLQPIYLRKLIGFDFLSISFHIYTTGIFSVLFGILFSLKFFLLSKQMGFLFYFSFFNFKYPNLF